MTAALKKFASDWAVGLLIFLMGVSFASGVTVFRTVANADAILAVEKKVRDVDGKVATVESDMVDHKERHTEIGRTIWPAIGKIPEMQREIREIARKQDTVMTSVATTAATVKAIEKILDQMSRENR